MTTDVIPAAGNGSRRRSRDDTRLALAFITPAAVGFLVFLIWPLIRGIYLSFTSYNLLTPAEFNRLTIRLLGFQQMDRDFDGVISRFEFQDATE